jgi:hypothetical protein
LETLKSCQSISAEIDRVKKENDNMQIELRQVFQLRLFSPFHLYLQHIKVRMTRQWWLLTV